MCFSHTSTKCFTYLDYFKTVLCDANFCRITPNREQIENTRLIKILSEKYHVFSKGVFFPHQHKRFYKLGLFSNSFMRRQTLGNSTKQTQINMLVLQYQSILHQTTTANDLDQNEIIRRRELMSTKYLFKYLSGRLDAFYEAAED